MIAGPPVQFTVSSTAPSAALARVGATTTDNGARADVDLIAAPVLPRGEVQPGNVWVTADGARIDETRLGSWSISVEDGGVLEWSAATAAESRGVRGPMGYEGAEPAMAGREIALGVDIGAAVYTLASGCKVVDSGRGLTPGERIMEVSGLGVMGRYDRLEVTLTLPPEHGLTVGQLAARMLTDAGVPAARVEIGSIGPALRNPVDLVDQPALDTARELLRHHGHALVERDGVLLAVARSPVTGDPRVTLRLADVHVESAFAIETTSDAPHKVRVEGTRHEIPGDAEGETTTEHTTTVSRVVGLKQAPWQQSSPTGILVSTGLQPIGPERERVVSETTRRETSKAGCLIARETIDRALHRRSAARYRQDAAGGILGYQDPVWIYEPGAVSDDGSPAYLDIRETLREVARSRETFEFGEVTGEMESRARAVSGWLNPPHAVQTRTASTQTWESVGFIVNQLVLADGSGVVLPAEIYLDGPHPPAATGTGQSLLVSYLEWYGTDLVTDNGYIEQEIEEQLGRRILTGWRHRYADGTESNRDDPKEGPVGGVTRSWSDTTAGGARREEITVDADGKLVERVSTPEPNGLPAVPRCDRDSRLRASTVPVVACVEMEGGTGTLEITSPWIETLEQAERLAALELRIARARRLVVSIPIMPPLRLHDRVDVWMPELGVEIVGEGWVESIGHTIEPAEAATRRLTELVVRLA